MADEPNKRMDEAVKAYAEKRRQDAGAPFELHPATRAMLQGEVARNYKQLPESSWWRRTILLWPRVAFAAACVAVTVTLLLITLPRQRMSEMAQTSSESEVLTRDRRVDEKKQTDESLAALADAPPLSTAPRAPTAQPADKMLQGGEADELKAAKAETMVAGAEDAAAAKLAREEQFAEKEVARTLYKNTAQQPAALYSRQQSNEVQLGVKLKDAESPQAVLNSFEFQKSGNQVRVIDQDGSIYVGNVVSNVEARKRDVSLQNARAGASGDAAAVPQERMTFYATGTNLSLRQKVSIEANILWSATNVVNRPAAPADAPGPSQNVGWFQKQPVAGPQNAIRGRARVGTNQEVYFEAVPAKP